MGNLLSQFVKCVRKQETAHPYVYVYLYTDCWAYRSKDQKVDRQCVLACQFPGVPMSWRPDVLAVKCSTQINHKIFSQKLHTTFWRVRRVQQRQTFKFPWQSARKICNPPISLFRAGIPCLSEQLSATSGAIKRGQDGIYPNR